jgi:hypothetical protein
MLKPLPDPVWWLAGNPRAAEMFMEGFVPKFMSLVDRGGRAENEGKEV